MHNGGVSRDRPPHNVVDIVEVDDHDLLWCSTAVAFADTDELVRGHRERLEADAGWVYAQSRELCWGSEREREMCCAYL